MSLKIGNYRNSGIVLKLTITLLVAGLYLGQAQANLSDLRLTDDIVLSKEDSDAITKKLPLGVRRLIEDETVKNAFLSDPENIQEFERLGPFSPAEGLWFMLPHFEIPWSEFKRANLSAKLDVKMEELFFFKKGGVKFVRYFVHPYKDLKNYEPQLKKYDLTYDYLARATASPRSLLVIKQGQPETVHWVKVSLHTKLTDLQRRQKPEKMARALAVNESLNAIPATTRNQVGFDYLDEPIALQMPGKEEVIIGRKMHSLLLKKTGANPSVRSTFSLFHSGEKGVDPDVTAMIKKSGLSDLEFFKRYMVQPVCQVFAYLAIKEGIQWGIHVGNYGTILGSNGLPNKKLVLKDFDGAWFDIEMRALQGKTFQGTHEMTIAPFSEFLFPSATGRNSGPRQHFGEIYNRYLRNASGFSSLGSHIYQYMLANGYKGGPEKLKSLVQDTIDTAMIEEVKKLTSIELTLADMKSGHLKVNGLNKALNQHRKDLLDKTSRADIVEENQDVLRKEFARLAALKRTWTAGSSAPAELAKRLDSPNMAFFYHRPSGMIQARSYRGAASDSGYTIYGYALVEGFDNTATQSFIKKLKTPKGKKGGCKVLWAVRAPNLVPAIVVEASVFDRVA